MVILYALYTYTATASGTTGAERLNTDQIIGLSVGLAGAAATIIAAIIATLASVVSVSSLSIV